MSEVPFPRVDVQTSRPRTEVSLTRVGVRGIEKVIKVNGGRAARLTDGEQVSAAGATAGDYFFAELECFVDLNPRQAGVHMSRFEEVVGEAIDSVVLRETLRAEELAAPDAILTTNTSSLSVDDVGAELQRPERFAGLHFLQEDSGPEIGRAIREWLNGLDPA